MVNKIKILNYLRDVLVDSQCALDLLVNNFSFTLEPAGDEIQVWINNEQKYVFNSFDDFLNKFIVNDKPLIEQLEFIEFL